MRNLMLFCVVLPALIASALIAQISPVSQHAGINAWFMQTQSTPTRASGGTVASFTSPIVTVATAQAFEAFIEKHRGKLVHLNVKVGNSFSKINDDNDFFVSKEPCGENTSSLDCDGAHYMIAGKDFVLRKYGAMSMLIGYFIVDEDVEMHQGTYYGLKAIPAEKVLLRQ